MGCCLSCRDERRRHSHGGVSPSPTPPILEEETVKEVLLETPVRVKPPVAIEESKENPQIHEERKEEIERKSAINCSNPVKVALEDLIESEISEVRSVSESFSNSTVQERNEDAGGEVNQKLPPSGRRQGALGVRRRTPARRPAAPLPEKKVQVAPFTPVRSRSPVGAEKRRRRDAGESSCTRSRSPAKLRGVVERRYANETAENSGNGGGKGGATAQKPSPEDELTEEAESLENPVVSLECFIFL